MKKFLSAFSILLVLLNQSLYIMQVYALTNLELTSFAIGVNSTTSTTETGDILAKPGDILNMMVSGENKGDTISNVEVEFSFSDTNFTYYEPGTVDSYVWWSPLNQNISQSLFNPPLLNKAPITTSSAGGDIIDLYWTKIQLNDTFSSYYSTISGKFLGGGSYVGNTKTRDIYVDVKPHITDYYFEKGDGSSTTTQIQGSDAEPINLVFKVKDYNGCDNISGGTATANLSQLGLTSSENLTFVSCDTGTKTATFKKSGITTSVSNGTYNFSPSNFSFTDSNGNQNNYSDSRFGSIDKTTTLSLTVVSATAPSVTLVNLDDNYIGGASNLTATLSFSANQNGQTKIIIGTDGNCGSGTILEDWTSYTGSTTKSFTINASNLSVGNNSIYACVKNAGGNIGSINVNITKDTTSPTTPSTIISPANIILNDSSIRYSCNENGVYEVRYGGTGNLDGTFVGSGSAVANTEYTTSLSNSIFTSYGSYVIYGYCKDNAGNYSYGTGSVNKVQPTPAMGTINSFLDNDIDYNGIDGKDITTTWDNTSAVSSSVFESYRIYLLPSNITFSTGSQTYIKLLTDKNLSSWTGDSSITKDSLNQTLVSGGAYKICIAIMGTSGQLGTESCSSSAVLTSDTVQNAKVTSAKFTSSTNLELTTDATMDTTLSTHSGGLISYVYNGATYTGTSVSSVNGTKINITIPALNNLGATGSTLLLQTGALHSLGGGYNNYFSSGSLVITDGQSPTVTSFVNNTTSPYNSFYSGTINVGFTFAEQMRDSGYTKILFDRTAGNTSTQKIFGIVSSSNLTSGAKTQNLTLNGNLVSGTTYNMYLYGEDLAGNSVTSSGITVKFDNVGPAQTSIIDTLNTSSTTPTLSWTAPSDDSGNGSGVGSYVVKVYSSSDCSGAATQTLSSSTVSKTTNALSNGTYSRNVYAVDNVGNIGTTSTCDSFVVDTSIPTITNLKITDTTLNSTTYAKAGDTITITATLTNTNSGKILANLSALTGNAAHTAVSCANPVSGVTCSYNAGALNYSFILGYGGSVTEAVRQTTLNVSNPGDTNSTSSVSSITVDSTNPTTGTISSPSGTIGGNSNNIVWSGISDTNLDYLKFEYSSNGGSSYNLIGTGANSSPRVWDTSALSSGSNYKVRITAYDRATNQSLTETATFTIDKDGPTISAGTITAPTSGEYVKGSSTYNITWNTGNITDVGGLGANPIQLLYSTDSTNWISIASSLPNSGIYAWSVPAINSSTVKLRMIVSDNVGNTTTFTNATTFIVDSTAPTFSIGVSTPPNGKYVNANGFDVEGTANDSYLKSVSYSFQRVSDSYYWNGTTYVASQTWNTLQDNISQSTYNINSLATPSVTNGATYDLVIKTTDYAGNEFQTVARRYTGDTTNPTLNITTSSGTYFKNSVTIYGTSSDGGAGISSVKIAIKKGSSYFDGTTWVGTATQLTTTTSNSYANWNYTFNPPVSDSNGQVYEVIVYGYDSSYKVNNSTTNSILTILDNLAPDIASTLFTLDTTSLYIGGANLSITWNTGDITDTGSNLASNPIGLEYYDGVSTWNTIASNLANNGSYNFTLPSLDSANVRIRLSATDNVGNIAYKISNPFTVDSTPPTISSVETMDMDANGQIDALQIIMSESIKDSTIVLSDFSIGSGVGTPSSLSTGNSSNDDRFILNFSNTGTTATKPTLSYTKGSLTDLAGKFLATISNVTSTDTAVPRISKAEAYDTNANGKLDKIAVTFSENMSSTTNTTAFSINGKTIFSVSVSLDVANIIINEGSSYDTGVSGLTLDFTSNANWQDNASNQAGSLGSSLNVIDKAKPILVSGIISDTNSDYVGDKVILTFSETLTGTLAGFTLSSGTINTTTLSGTTQIVLGVSSISGTNPSITLNYSGDLNDGASNTMDNITTYSLSEQIPPKLLSATTVDTDFDGKINKINMHFSENITGSFSDFAVSVNSYSLAASSTYAFSGSTDVLVTLDEKQIFDSEVTPLVLIDMNTSIKDSSNNILTPLQSVTSTDGVGPVITGARFDEGTKNLYLNFSENVITALDDTSFSLNNTTASISAVSFTPGNSTATLNLSNTGITYGSSEVSFSFNTASDNTGNKQSGFYYTKISASVLINEYMANGDVKYIELKNISSAPVDISGWIVQNALGVGSHYTIPASQNISAGGYYLISTNDTSFSGVTANQTASLNFSSNLVLKNGSITVDSALYQASTTNVSKERLSSCSNSLSSSCWYSGVASNGFINTTYKGTPKTNNVFDAVLPSVTSTTPTNDTIYPFIPSISTTFNYQDDASGVGINTGSVLLSIEKYNGSAWNVDNSITINTGSITTAQSNFTLTGFNTYGRYRAVFKVSDLAGNEVTENVIFYVDNFSFSLDRSNIDLGVLQAGSTKLSDDIVTITINTIGAGFTLTHTATNPGNFASWTGTGGYGGCLGNGCSTLEDFSNKQVVSQAKNLQSSGSLATYTYEVRYGSLIDSLQAAGVYNFVNENKVILDY